MPSSSYMQMCDLIDEWNTADTTALNDFHTAINSIKPNYCPKFTENCLAFYQYSLEVNQKKYQHAMMEHNSLKK
jgi:hypothetical protein